MREIRGEKGGGGGENGYRMTKFKSCVGPQQLDDFCILLLLQLVL